jgi:hypothetical protein
LAYGNAAVTTILRFVSDIETPQKERKYIMVTAEIQFDFGISTPSSFCVLLFASAVLNAILIFFQSGKECYGWHL